MVKAILLAAGRGNRISSLLGGRSKVLLEIGGESIISRQLKCLTDVGIDGIFVVVGYDADCVEFHIRESEYWSSSINLVLNYDYETTDNSYSVGLGLAKIDENEEVIVLDGDIVYDSSLIDLLVKTSGCVCLVDDTIPSVEEDAKVLIEDGFVTAIGKHIESGPVYTSMIKLSGRLLSTFKSEINQPRLGREWYSEPLTRALARNRRVLLPVSTRGARRCEIDDPADLDKARRLFGSLSRF